MYRYIPEIRHNPSLGVAVSLVLVGASFVSRYYTPLTLPYVTFYPAIMLATVAAGRLAGIAMAAISSLLVIYFITPGGESFAITEADLWNVCAFQLVSLLIIIITDFLVRTVIRVNEQAHLLTVADQQRAVLVRELSHRMKNQYAVILAMSRAIGTSATSATEFQKAFTQRLHGLSRTHDILIEAEWKSVPINKLIEMEMQVFAIENAYSVEGPPVDLTDIAAFYLGLAIHELATNCAKHGAWSKENGKVTISWKLNRDQFIFIWQEREGPAVNSTIGDGFGRKVLEQIVANALRGSTELAFEREGLQWKFVAPAIQVIVETDKYPATPIPNNKNLPPLAEPI
jgi:two-component sensor histidine kinase